MTIRRHDRSFLRMLPPHTGPKHTAPRIGYRAADTVPRHATAAITLALVLSGCTSDNTGWPAASSAASPSQTNSGFDKDSGADAEPEVVAQELEAPWSLAFYKNMALVSERDSARILEIDDQRPARAREITTVAGVSASGEGGLLGLSVYGDKLYAYFTTESDNRSQRFPLLRGSEGVQIGPPETILDGIAKAGFHNGGRLAFGPDGQLYATVGDAGDRSAAQDRESFSGSIMRMKPDGSVPEDNPFNNSLVYSYGHRNPQGLAWDEDGTMYASEFGQDTWDELNIIEAEVAYAGEFGRLRDVVTTPSGEVWILTNNTDGRGDPAAADDRILRIPSDLRTGG